MTSRFGRKGCLISMAFVFTIGGLFQLFATGIEMLYTGRFICGFAVGTLSMAATLYQVVRNKWILGR